MANYNSASHKASYMSEVEKNQDKFTIGDVVRLQGGDKVTLLEIHEFGFEYTAFDGSIDCLGWEGLGLHTSIVSAKRKAECVFLNLDNSNYDRWITHLEHEELQAFWKD